MDKEGCAVRRTLCLLLALLVLPLSALAAEGDPLLNAEELGELRESYEAFLDELEDMIVENGRWIPLSRGCCSN